MNTASRREFLRVAALSMGGMAMVGETRAAEAPAARRPNVVLMLTDDQGYGDLACHGNPHIKTPNMDRLRAEGVRFEYFYVSPVCSPTRANLMTGRYNYRTRAIDTYAGRSMMDPDEVTMAEMLGDGGYKTGIFGKWHLGDNYPMRAMDQGFQESLVHRGGGLCQPSDWPGNTYFDPMLSRNGVDWKSKGYCTDVYTDAALEFITAHRNEPFFCYFATNAPHTPLQIADEYAKLYLDMGLEEDTAKVYGMVTNIDDNIGRILAKLDELGIEKNTVVIFLTDNGPQGSRKGVRYNAGLRSAKGAVYEGGIRVPCFVRWPGTLDAGKSIDRVAAHIDLLPTLLDVCGVAKREGVALDGRSLKPLLLGENTEWPDRTLYFQWHRGDAPELYRDCAARSQRYKLVNGVELYDIEADPGELNDIAKDRPEIVREMRAGYEAWFKDVSCTRGYDPPRIHLGTPHENPVVLTRQDWRGSDGWDSDKDLGYWEVCVTEAADYEITLRFAPVREASEARFKFGGVETAQALESGAAACVFNRVALPQADGRLEASVLHGGEPCGVLFVEVKR
ncbi:MAG: hypothetical protein QG656_1748 [Candidatus Hydrogenedentes bacterium]|nr:hypothetical protein [Candidatus Hydrogenedentota bacterium]